MLEINKIKKTIPGILSLSADFKVATQERAVLVGPSGSGKTTLLRIIAGLDAADSGEITLDSNRIDGLPSARRNIGVVFQDQSLFPALTVMENICFGLKVRGVSKFERERQGAEWLKRIGLMDRVNSSVTQLSGGEKQRVAFARALIWKPELLLLDEPFSALDFKNRAQMREELVRLHAVHPAPLLLVTHDEEDARAIAQVRLAVREASNSGWTITRTLL